MMPVAEGPVGWARSPQLGPALEYEGVGLQQLTGQASRVVDLIVGHHRHDVVCLVEAVAVSDLEHGQVPPQSLDQIDRATEPVAVPAGRRGHAAGVAGLGASDVPAQRLLVEITLAELV